MVMEGGLIYKEVWELWTDDLLAINLDCPYNLMTYPDLNALYPNFYSPSNAYAPLFLLPTRPKLHS